jgi:DAACS family dicarboxylate/amino acid:cation (Na+ or H+) symporter
LPHLEDRRRGLALHHKILIGLFLGAFAGGWSNYLWRGSPRLEWVAANVAEPVGQVFLRMLFMVVVPLVFTSLALGVAQLGDLSRVGRVGLKTIAFFLATTGLAAVLGLVIINVAHPGDAISPEVRSALLARYAGEAQEKAELARTGGFGVQTFVNIVPRNPVDSAARLDMLGLIFFTLVFGVALTRIPADSARPVIRFLEGVSQAVTVIIGFAMRLAPFGVAGLIFAVTARFGFDVLRSLAAYVAVVMGALLLHLFGVIPALAKLLTGIGPATFLGRCREMMITAFSTSSSNATLPTTLRTATQNFGVPREIAGFVIPLGATMNMNGTALFEGMTVLFLAQVFGVELGLGAQVVVVVMSVITAVGAAGVPGGSLPLLVLVLGMVGVPPEGLALILGVDRILDMTRTVPNVTGDLLTSLVITRSEGLPLVPPPPDEDMTVVSPAEAAAEHVELPGEAEPALTPAASGRGPA